MQSLLSYLSNFDVTSNDGEVNGGILQFPNKICLCGLRALIESSEASTSPKML